MAGEIRQQGRQGQPTQQGWPTGPGNRSAKQGRPARVSPSLSFSYSWEAEECSSNFFLTQLSLTKTAGGSLASGAA